MRGVEIRIRNAFATDNHIIKEDPNIVAEGYALYENAVDDT